MKNLKLPRNSGLILEPFDKKIAVLEQVFGMPASEVLIGSASKDWRGFYPEQEIQSNGDCVTFSRLNCAETKGNVEGAKDEDGKPYNFSDLDLAVGSGTTLSGNSLVKVSDYGRKTGVVLEKYCPYERDWNKRQAMVDKIPAKAKRYLLGNYASVGGDSPVGNENGIGTEFLINGLEKSPLQIAVGLNGTTYFGKGIIKKPDSYTVYHAMEMGYVDLEGNRYCLDHYNRREVILEANYPILSALAFIDLPANWRGLNVPGQTLHARLLGKLILRAEAHGELYRVYDDRLELVYFNITDKALFDAFHRFAREKGLFIGISEKDFNTLLEVVFGKIIESKPINQDDLIKLVQ